jgi:predicted nucleotidyltransferase
MARTLKSTGAELQIRCMVRRIVRRFRPERIILFGSRARGDARPDSDIDLLIVMAVEGSVRDKRLEIRQALHDSPFPLDVIVTRPEDFAWRKDVVGTIEWPAAREGRVLYANASSGHQRDSGMGGEGGQ